MIGGRSVLAVIPARGGSKGVPRKNIRLLAGKPLIAWTIEAAAASCYIDRTIVSTDDLEIADICIRYGGEVPFMRPAELARDDTPGIAPVLHALEALTERYDLVVLLQATSPLRNTDDIDGCIANLAESGARCCVSLVEPDKSPYWMYRRTPAGHLAPLLEGVFDCRQDLPEIYALNGAVYVADSAWLAETKLFITPETVGYVMPKERSFDIDSELDLKICNFLITEAS